MVKSYSVTCTIGEDCVVVTNLGKTIRLKRGQKVKVSLSEISGFGINSIKIAFRIDGEERFSFLSREKIIAPGGARVME